MQGTEAENSCSEPTATPKTRFLGMLSFARSPSSVSNKSIKSPVSTKISECALEPHSFEGPTSQSRWHSLPSVVTWNYAPSKVQSSLLLSEEVNASEESGSTQLISNCSTAPNNDVENCDAHNNNDQQSCQESENNDLSRAIPGQNPQKASTYLGGLKERLVRAFSIRTSNKAGKKAEELHAAFERAKRDLAEREAMFLSRESELMGTLIRVSDALDASESVKKRWGWLTYSSTLREIETLKCKVQTVRSDLEALRADFSVEHTQLLSRLTDAEQEYIAAKTSDLEPKSKPQAKTIESPSVDKKGSWTVARTSLLFWPAKSKSSLSAPHQAFQNLPSVVTWCNIRKCSPEDANTKPGSAAGTTRLSKVSKMLGMIKSPKISIFERMAFEMPSMLSPGTSPARTVDAAVPEPPISDFRRLPSVVTWCQTGNNLLEQIDSRNTLPIYSDQMCDTLIDGSVQDPTLGSECRISVEGSKTDIAMNFKSLPSVVTWHVYKPNLSHGKTVDPLVSTSSLKPFLFKIFRQFSSSFTYKSAASSQVSSVGSQNICAESSSHSESEEKSIRNGDDTFQSPCSISRSPAHLSQAGTCEKEFGRTPAGYPESSTTKGRLLDAFEGLDISGTR